jgi:hypothetical protein
VTAGFVWDMWGMKMYDIDFHDYKMVLDRYMKEHDADGEISTPLLCVTLQKTWRWQYIVHCSRQMRRQCRSNKHLV